jgi:cyclic pyranopterin phosphate synthase
MTGLSDSFQRPIDYLRVSVTDRCNLRCVYCVPSAGFSLLSHSDVLRYEEIYDIVAAAAELGVSRVRLTGGEPLMRLHLADLVRMIRRIPEITDISMTTNGLLLAHYAAELKQAGLQRVNVSLDTLKPERFRCITRSTQELDGVLAGIEAAQKLGMEPVKINTVVMAGFNDDEVINFAQKTICDGWHVRFIELMQPEGVAVTADQVMSAAEIKKRLDPLGHMERCHVPAGGGPAKYFRFPGAQGTVGFITPVSEHFCYDCNRLRLTSDGKLKPCLLSNSEIDLREPLRGGADKETLKELIRRAIAVKPRRQNGTSDGFHNRSMTQTGG